MTNGQEETLATYGSEIIPRLRRRRLVATRRRRPRSRTSAVTGVSAGEPGSIRVVTDVLPDDLVSGYGSRTA